MEAEALDEARVAHGRLIQVDLRGRVLFFRPMGLDEAQATATRLDRAPSAALTTALAAVRKCCVSDLQEFDEAAENFPLAFSAESGVCATLLAMASDELSANVKEAIARWRTSERQLGVIAEDLLAFKAYTGGVADAKTLAGALHVADLIDTTKGLYKLHLAFMNAMGKRRG